MQTVIGGKQAPALAASANAIHEGDRAVRAATSAASAAGNTNAQLSSIARGPWRSISRPSIGAKAASPAT